MQLTIVNLTTDTIVASNPNTFNQALGALPSETVLLPSANVTTTLKSQKLTLRLQDALHTKGEKWTVALEGLFLRFSFALEASWQVIQVPEGCPWRMYCSRVTRKSHRLLILPRRDMARFLSDMPNRLPLSSLMLPGTHDTMAFYGWPISQCQSASTPLSTQLLYGIRVLDIRLAIIQGSLIAYHGIYPERTPFQSILASVHTFLSVPATSRETIVMSIKQEDFAVTPSKNFSRLVRAELERGPGGKDMWFLENRIPKLGEVRGKVVMFSRFGGNGDEWENGLEGIGIHPTTWPDSEKHGFSWDCKGTLVRTHDWYAIPSFLYIPEKVALATGILLPPQVPVPMPTLSISFLSAASFPLALPPSVAQGFGWPKWGLGVEGVNSRAGKWLLDVLGGERDQRTTNRGGDGNGEKERLVSNGTEGDEPRLRGWVLMDYFNHPENQGLVPLLVECNYRGRVAGEEGW